jgi:hypothetical protein
MLVVALGLQAESLVAASGFAQAPSDLDQPLDQRGNATQLASPYRELRATACPRPKALHVTFPVSQVTVPAGSGVPSAVNFSIDLNVPSTCDGVVKRPLAM